MPETIAAEELSLVGIFNDNYRFEIPDYQRPYSWTTEQTGELLDDLLYALSQFQEINEASPYFLGSIVVIKSDGSPKAVVVDGQQRITTLTILFCVLRELTTDATLKGTRDRYIRETSDPDAGIEGKFRLSVRDRDSSFFQDNFQTMGKMSHFMKLPPVDLPDSQQRMFENAKYLWDKLSKMEDERRSKLTGFLVRRCYLVVVSTSDQDSAYRIFSVLNDRGLDLSPTDILKAQIVGGLDESIRSDYTETWEDIEDELGRDGFRSLFAHIRTIYMKDKARGELNKEFQEGVLREFQEGKPNLLKSKKFIDDVLIPYADAYEKVVLPEADGFDEVDLYLGHLGRLDNSDWVPPAMEFFKRNPHNSADSLRFVRDLERLAYGMFIRRADINRRIRRYAEVIRAIEKGENLHESGPLQLSDDEKIEILRILDGPIYSQVRVRTPLILRLDSLLADEGVVVQRKIISIEHVLPQNPAKDSEWLEWFPDEEVRNQWTHKISNLVLLSRRKNSQANNRNFKDKKETYFRKDGVAPPFPLTIQVLGESKWTKDILECRQSNLIGKLKEEWRLD